MAINSLSSASHGFSGLASGMNSQEMVEKLLSGTQGKIDKANQDKSVLSFKQTMYREVATQMRKLQNNFFDLTNPATNLLSSGFYNDMVASILSPSGTSPAFTVSASSEAAGGNTTVDYIKQLAKPASLKTDKQISSDMQLNLDHNVIKNIVDKNISPDGTANASTTLSISVGDKKIEIENAPKLFSQMSSNQVANYINNEFKKEGVEGRAYFMNGNFTIESDDPKALIKVNGNGSDRYLAMQMFGGTSGTMQAAGKFTTSIDTQSYNPSFNVNLDGREQAIHLDLNLLENLAKETPGTAKYKDAEKALMDDVSERISKAFGNGVKLVENNGSYSIKAGNDSQRVTITGRSNVMDAIGLKTGASNKINLNVPLREAGFGTELQGEIQRFSIDGVDFAFSSGTSLKNIIQSINSSSAGVKISYLESEDRFIMERTRSGYDDEDFELKNVEGNFLSCLFGIEGSGAYTGKAINKDLVGKELDALDLVALETAFGRGGYLTVNINGVDRVITLENKKEDDLSKYTIDDLVSEVNKQLTSIYGRDYENNPYIEFSFDENTNQFTFVSNKDDLVIKAGAGSSGMDILGFEAGDSTRITDKNTTLAEAGIEFGNNSSIDFKVNGNSYNVSLPNWDEDTTMSMAAKDIENAIKSAMVRDNPAYAQSKLDNIKVEFDEYSSSFKISGIEENVEMTLNPGSGSVNTDNLFGKEKLVFNEPATGQNIFTGGQNAILSVNGSEIQRSSNTFALDGLTFNLVAETVERDADGDITSLGSATQISTIKDTKKIYDGIEAFIEEYNELINYVTSLYRADPTYKDYAPLTQEQKNSMTDKEIEKWEAKSMEGLLRGDQTLGKILQDMRSVLYYKPQGSSIALYDLGIKTNTDGTLSVESESTLRSMIEKNSDQIQNLFAGSDGIMRKLSSNIDAAAKASSASPGTLVQIAGSTTAKSHDSRIAKQMKELDKQLVSLEKRYWSEYDRYWKQFNQMEQLISQMNSQSSWMSQQLSSL